MIKKLLDFYWFKKEKIKKIYRRVIIYLSDIISQKRISLKQRPIWLTNINKELGSIKSGHPIFMQFSAYRGKREKGVEIDYLGCIELPHYVPSDTISENLMQLDYNSKAPNYDEEYFEWIDILESAKEAKTNYCIIELGAGYGRWSVRGYNAAIACGIRPDKIQITAVEAEPRHFNWINDHFKANNIQCNHQLYHAAVAGTRGHVEFCISQPNVNPEDITASRKWYGQAIVNGRWEGSTTIRVETVTLQEILDRITIKEVDLLDIDIQGAEFEVLNECTESLKRVKRVHIGTHSREIEMSLRHLFHLLGWSCIRDYPCNSVVKTKYGKISFGDGVQTWLNPKNKNRTVK